MRNLLILFIIVSVYANSVMENLSAGAACTDNDGKLYVASFFVTPYPLTCTQQSVALTGQFMQKACPSKILIHQIYNGTQTYDQQINLHDCYNKGQQVTFEATVNPFQCLKGNYAIQINIETYPDVLACWQYAYTL